MIGIPHIIFFLVSSLQLLLLLLLVLVQVALETILGTTDLFLQDCLHIQNQNINVSEAATTLSTRAANKPSRS